MIRVVRRSTAIAAVLAGLLALLVGVAVLLRHRWLPSGRALPGTLVGGWAQPAGLELATWLERRKEPLSEREVYLRLPEETVTTTLGALGVELDVDETARRVLAQAESGSLGERLGRAWQARRGLGDLELAWSFDRERARATLHELGPRIRREPVDAELDLGAHRRVPEQPGWELDLAGTLDQIRDGGCGEGSLFVVATQPIAPRVTTSMLAQVDVSLVLSSYETRFGGTGEGRARNIAQAAARLDGTVLAPDQILSFNERVGERTVERGFTLAPVIFDDELTPGLGGGVCQVASTLHAASVYGGMAVLERHNHSRPSSYIPMGLDATVIYGEVDLKFRNPYPNPVIIHAFLPTPSRLRIELLGQAPPGKVEYTYWIEDKEEFYRRVTTQPWLGSRSIRRQKGSRGYHVRSLVRVLGPDGSSEARAYKSEYRPTPEVYWVGPQHDASLLPELPEGAARVEYDHVTPPGR
jgi:vancomycin resistance protein YoaR